MTELRQRWERDKAALLAEGRFEGRAEGRFEGRAEGRFEGRFEGRAESILTLLKARGLPVSEPVKARVLGCKDLTLLDQWLVRAATAASDTEVIAA